jgi:hypothetical protein
MINPNPPGPFASTDVDRDEKARAALKQACDEAFVYAPAAHSCSHAVWYVIQKLVDAKAPLRTANDLLTYLTKNWQSVSLEDGWKLANKGAVVVGGKREAANGHVIVIYPGDKVAGGGYPYQTKNKITGKMETVMMRSHGIRPRCLSRTMGAWPGGTSKGEKNVFDPWGNDLAFGQVRFWTPKQP